MAFLTGRSACWCAAHNQSLQLTLDTVRPLATAKTLPASSAAELRRYRATSSASRTAAFDPKGTCAKVATKSKLKKFIAASSGTSLSRSSHTESG